MVALCARLEAAYGLAAGRLRFEVQVETPQAVLGADGTATVARLMHAAQGRCVGLHYGTYDYSAALGVAAAQQSLEHPVADHAKAVMQVAAAGTGVRRQRRVDQRAAGRVGRAGPRAAWALHARLVRRSLERGLYQGWDLHPAQLPTRFAATYALLPRRARRAAAPAARLPRRGVRRRSSTSRRPPGRWPASCCAGWTAARCVDEAEVTGVPIATLDDLALRRAG